MTVTAGVDLATASIAPEGVAPGVQELTLYEHDEQHGAGVWRNLLIVVWRKETRADAVEGVSAILTAVARRHSDVALLQVIEEGATAPDSDARRALSTMLRTHGGAIRCSAVVYEGDGFRAATLRAVVAGIALLGRPVYPHVVFASTMAAINWTARHFSHDGPVWAEQVRNAVDEVRLMLDRRHPDVRTSRPIRSP
ncbi:MAG TPA: hypothetical protein VFV94_19115 [Polyangiaceae bacterium]|nr:hypothetical protein [Polyangiaceae bacterium]